MNDWNSRTGWAKHSIFGLRQEWLEQFILNPDDWSRHAILGNKQVDSFGVWLRTCDIQERSSKLTFLGEQFISLGVRYLPLWELLWINVVFNFPTAQWYTTLVGDKWTTTELIDLLHTAIPRLAKRTISNAVMELAGLLERTPVGTELRQGQVLNGRPRTIVRTGCKPSDAAIMHSMDRLFLQQGSNELHWHSDLAWPWIVFRCDRQFILERLTIIEQDIFYLDEHGVGIRKSDREGLQCGDMISTLL